MAVETDREMFDRNRRLRLHRHIQFGRGLYLTRFSYEWVETLFLQVRHLLEGEEA